MVAPVTICSSTNSSISNTRSITSTESSIRASYKKTTTVDKAKATMIEYARNKHKTHFADSRIVDRLDEFPTFDKDELNVGKVLGKGQFGTVFEISGMKNIKDEPTDEQRFLANHCLREHNGDARYAIKVLSPNVLEDPEFYMQGLYDMSIETRILSDTEHTNIVKARAFAKVSPFCGDEFFIMMDRLYDTLEKRIKKWKKIEKRFTSFLGKKMFDRKGTKLLDIHIKKITFAYDLSDAIAYLHGRKIVYRDLKPVNIAFDIRDDIKLFDFGLSTELKKDRKVAGTDTYQLTGMTGSPRYMSNEVANYQPYNEKSDVYSMGILIWQMLSTNTPFESYTMKSLSDTVWNGEQKRPYIDPSWWSESIRQLLQRMWAPNHKDRPNFQHVTKILRTELAQLLGCNDKRLQNHLHRRSTFVFDKKNKKNVGINRSASMKMLFVSDFSSSLEIKGDESTHTVDLNSSCEF